MYIFDFIPLPPQCYCHFENGDSGRNGNLCGSFGNFTKVVNCIPDQWSAGPSNESNALKWTKRHKLCKTPDVLCYEKLFALSCHLYPRRSEGLGDNWCSNQCYLESKHWKM